MIKKIALFFILIIFAVSCGKKGDPKYKETQTKTIIEKIFIKIS